MDSETLSGSSSFLYPACLSCLPFEGEPLPQIWSLLSTCLFHWPLHGVPCKLVLVHNITAVPMFSLLHSWKSMLTTSVIRKASLSSSPLLFQDRWLAQITTEKEGTSQLGVNRGHILGFRNHLPYWMSSHMLNHLFPVLKFSLDTCFSSGIMGSEVRTTGVTQTWGI